MKTYEDLEREAYITGNLEKAAVYAELIDKESTIQELEDDSDYNSLANLEWQIDELESEVIYWKERAEKAERKLKNIKEVND